MILFGWRSFSQTLRHIRITYDAYEKYSFPKILIQWVSVVHKLEPTIYILIVLYVIMIVP